MSDGYEWELRLFVSIDLVGSTAYKSKDSSKSEAFDWATTFKEFFTGFPLSVRKQYSNSQIKDKEDRWLRVWKFLGDEILFETKISATRDILSHVGAIHSALVEQNQIFTTKQIDLQCKGTCWTAGFPLRNNSIELDSYGTKIKDFIGPSIDAGFRIAKHASPRSLVLSVECAYIIGRAFELQRANSGKKENQFDFFFGGKHVLKGVISDLPYPIFWIDCCHGTKDPLEDKWEGLVKVEVSEIVDYCGSIFEKSKKQFRKPFIENDEDKVLHDIPFDLVESRHRKMDQEKTKEQLGFGDGVNIGGSKIDAAIHSILDQKSPKNSRKKSTKNKVVTVDVLKSEGKKPEMKGRGRPKKA